MRTLKKALINDMYICIIDYHRTIIVSLNILVDTIRFWLLIFKFLIVHEKPEHGNLYNFANDKEKSAWRRILVYFKEAT